MASNALGPTYGAILLAVIIAASFYGMTVLQIVYYFQRYQSDSRTLKLYALLLWCLDTMSIILEIHAVYWYLIMNFEDPAAGAIGVWSIMLESGFAYATIFVAQLYATVTLYAALIVGSKVQQVLHNPHPHDQQTITAFRSYHASHCYWSVLSRRCWHRSSHNRCDVIAHRALRLRDTLLTSYLSFRTPTRWSVSSGWFGALCTANKVLEMIADVSITLSLWTLLRRQKGNSRQTDSLLNRLIIFAINRGVFAAYAFFFSIPVANTHSVYSRALQTVYLVTYLALPKAAVWVVFHAAVSKVYTNSVLATLNSRDIMRGIAQGSDHNHISLSALQVRHPEESGDHVFDFSRGIRVDKEVDSMPTDFTEATVSQTVQCLPGDEHGSNLLRGIAGAKHTGLREMESR
ncbi:uncharacterized protein B0H18DRAFT_1216758 [Fomitopsis serialis]|uniref:uncharacterized protein n=1 Tax=Fomitopsis serialis TaxID=139415 RepID=UPI002007968E|nr:uncharacterized protein B0H18DRAFT_1216758 [Neoantrodia serialis]KAH9912835.1 hypothetical protein B0H18DRAFT_1216758 [Neoantrodia serialis]